MLIGGQEISEEQIRHALKTLPKDKADQLSLLLEKKAQQNSILFWADGKVNENGVRMGFEKHEFQKAIMEDFSEVIYVVKAAQIGVSTIFILKCTYMVQMFGYNIIYTLPTLQNDVMKFVPSKVEPILEKNGIKLTRNTTTQKQIGDGYWFFGGTFSEKEGIMTTADILVHDEVDRSNLEVIDTYKSRLGHSEYARRWYFSNPSAPNRGVHAGWMRSDQKHWMIKCSCGQGNYGGWQYLSWPQNVDYKNKKYVCIHCGREITDDMRRGGEWVKKYQRDISGYWVSQMMAPWIPCSRLINEEEESSKQFFYNFVLGLPYIGSDKTIDKDLILRNVSLKEPEKDSFFIGVDVGSVLHVVIGTQKGITKICTLEHWEDLDAFMSSLDPRQVVVDALPETHEVKKFQKKYPNKVKMCYYRKPQTSKPQDKELYVVDYKTSAVVAKRTEVIDAVIEEFSRGGILIYINPKEPFLTGGSGVKKGDSFAEQWESLYRYKDEEKDVFTWEHSGPDHFAHATVYYYIARKIGGTGIKYKVVVR